MKRFILLIIIVVLITSSGCTEKKATENSEESISSSYGTVANESLEKANWMDEVSSGVFCGWATPIVKNNEYIFYVSGSKIKRVDQNNGDVTTILDVGGTLTDYPSLYLAEDCLYYIFEGSLHKTDFSGEVVKDVATFNWLRSATGDEKGGNVWDITISKNKMYLLLDGYEVYYCDPVKKEVQCIATEIEDYCIFNNSLYYVSLGLNSIHKVDLATKQNQKIIGNEESSQEDTYRGLSVFNDDVYYAYNHAQLNRLDGKGNNIVVYKVPDNLFCDGSVFGEDAVYHLYDEDDEIFYLYRYDPASNTESSMKLPDDCKGIGGVFEDKVLYIAKNPNNPNEQLPYYKYIDCNW